MKKVSVFLVIFLTWVFVVYTPAFGQKSKFIVSGYMDWTYSWQKGKAGTFDLFHFNPIFLFQIEDKLLARAEVEYEHGGGEIVLEYAQLDWFLHDYVTISGGKFLVPFGVINNNKAVGGRLGIVPIKEIEIGASAYSGKYDDVASPKLSLNLYGVDAEFCYKEFLELRGEFNQD